jgi:predicted O-methyltransferase YrrM
MAKRARVARHRPRQLDDETLRALAMSSSSRMELWSRFIQTTGVREVAEIGVYRGNFAARMLSDCAGIATYYMIDPWRRLHGWNKPANVKNRAFARFYEEAIEKTRAWADKRVVLRGTTSRAIRSIPDGTLDFVYIDGDHTLRGITIDLVQAYAKVREGGWIAGDDFSRSIWQHDEIYEPTLVFPFAVHFAEAVGARIFALPHDQFLIEKRRRGGHKFIDLTGKYDALGLRSQLLRSPAPDAEAS